MNRAKLIAAAKRSAAKDTKARASDKFRRVVAAFGHAGLLRNNMGIKPEKAPLTLDEVLWAGEYEPRLLELLPAVLIKKPAMVTVTRLPPDLEQVLAQLRRNQVPDTFRGMPGRKLLEWLPKVGHKNKLPSQLKSFRFQAEDVALLKQLSEREGVNETQLIREALRAFSQR